MTQTTPHRHNVFISYSHRDQAWLERLQVHLKPLERAGLIDRWDDTRIRPGAQWRNEITQALAAAKVAVLLVSADFLASDFIATDELPPLLVAVQQDRATILPVIVGPCLYKHSPLESFQAVNDLKQPLIGLSPVDQEAILVRVAEAIVDALTDPFVIPDADSGAVSAGIWYVPLRPTPFFTGRESLLAHLHERLQHRRAVALTGLGGIGKTQAALAYAEAHRQDYRAVLWARAATRDDLITGFTTLATVLNLPERNATEQLEIVAAVRRWLERSVEWLLVLDNADDLSLVPEFVPAHHAGRLLITSRAAATGEVAENLPVERLPADAGALFLLRRARRVAQDAPLAAATPDDQAVATAVAGELGGLPLALDQAGAYLEEMQLTPGEYLSLYRQAGQSLRARRGELAADHPSVTVTFSLAFAQIAAANTAAAELLRLCAFLHPSGIPEEMLTEGAAELGPVLGPVLAQPLGLIELRREAGRFSLLHRDPASRMLLIHPVVQAVLKDDLDAAAQHDWQAHMIRLVNRCFPYIEFSNWPQCERLLPQTLACAEAIVQGGWTSVEAARLLNQTAVYLEKRARYEEAEPLYRRALVIREQTLGPNHPATAQSLNNLAGLYDAQGRYGETEPLYRRALAIWQQTVGPDDPDIAISLNNLAELYQTQGRYTEAEPLYRRALAIWEQALGLDHPNTALSLNNLAALYHAQGQYTEAEPLYWQALAIREQTLGPNHPDTANSLNNLAGLYDAQGRYGEAEPLYQRALAIFEQALGPDHPHTSTVRSNLARCLASMILTDRQPE